MANWTAEELYGGPREPTEFKRINTERLSSLEASERVLRQVYAAAREIGLIGEFDGAERLIAAIKALPRA